MSAAPDSPPLPEPNASALLAASPAALALLNADGLLIWANPAAGAWLGEADVGQSIEVLLDMSPAEQVSWRARFAEADALPLALRPRSGGSTVELRCRALVDGSRALSLHPGSARLPAGTGAQQMAAVLDLAQQSGRIGIWERDVRTKQGRWGPQVMRFWGMAPDGPTPDFETAVRAVIEPDRQERIRVFEQSLLSAGTYAHHYRVRRPDGSMRELHSQWTVRNGADGRPEGVLGILMDDTAARELARTRDELEAQLTLAVELAGIAIWRHDLASGRVSLNRQSWRMLDLEPRAQGLHIEEMGALMHPQDLPRVLASASTTLRERQATDVEARYRRRDGSYRHVLARRVVERDADGQALAIVGVGMDVTEQRTASQALRRAAERAALATRGAGIGTWDLDLRAEVNTWDEQMWRLRGRAPRAASPSIAEWMTFVHPDDRAAAERRVALQATMEESSNSEFRVVWPDGSVHWLAARSAPVRDDQGVIVRRIGVNWDITESRNAEAARHESEAARRESQAKSQFLSRMSHELRTPLNAVLGFTNLLLADEPDAENPRARRLTHVRAAGEHLLSLIDDVLDLSSFESGEVRIALAPAPLGPLVAATLPLLDPLRQAQGVTVHCGGLDVVPLADPTRLRQVLLNLLSNAIKYNRPGGSVNIDAQARGNRVVICVRDTGRGMSDEQLRHLFEPFNRLGIEGEGIAGTGIGLAIVKVLVERMGGSIHVDSRPGEGSLFELRLADAASAPAAPAPVGAPSAPLTRAARRGKLLYIEDNAVNAMIVAELLARRPDLQLSTAADGSSGLALAVENQPDLVLLDMQLPDIDGHEVLRRLRADPRTAAIPVIALSANAMPQDIERALAAGVSDYWTKPLDFRAFMASLDALFGPLKS